MDNPPYFARYAPRFSRFIGPVNNGSTCPNCGSKGIYIVDPPMSNRFFLLCSSCGAQSRTAHSQSEASKIWKSR